MPLFAWAVLVYAGTLIVTLGASVPARAPLLAALLALTGLLFLTSRWRLWMACAAVAAGGALVAMSVAGADAACSRSIAARGQWRATFESGALEGAVAHASVSDGPCHVALTVLVELGSAPAGTTALVRGRATPDPRGLFVEHARLSDVESAGMWLRLRAAAGTRIDRIFGADAPMVRALVIADMSQIPADVRDRYSVAGLVHMLSVSGLHVGIVALALELLASVLRLPPAPARIGTLVLLAAYVVTIGAPPPAVRAAVMLGAVLLTRLLQRPTSPWSILALGALTPLWDPHIALDLGWQLSVAGTAALIAGGALARRAIPVKWTGWRRSLAAGMTVSLVATAVTAPIVAWTFGRVSLLGPITNLVADPVMALLQPLLFLALAVPIRAVEVLSANAAHALLYAFDGIARVAVMVPGAAPVVFPSAFAAAASGVASVALVIACLSRHPAVPAIIAISAVGAIIVEPMLPRPAGVPELHMIDVGQGDALALRTSKGRWIVIDAGRSWIGGDAGKSTVVPYLAHHGGEIALFVLSHPHADHVGGARSRFAVRRPLRFLDPGYVGTTPPYLAALAESARDHIPWQRVRAGDSIVVDDIVLTELAPDSAWASTLADANLASTVLVARAGGARILFTGDAEGPEEEWLLRHEAERLHADVLKVGHHGSITSTTPRFLAAVHPSIALVSVGAHNSYGHPDAEVIDSLRSGGVITLRTDLLGTVVLRFRGSRVEIDAGGHRWTQPLSHLMNSRDAR